MDVSVRTVEQKPQTQAKADYSLTQAEWLAKLERQQIKESSMTTSIEAVIQRDVKDDGRVVLYVVPSPVLGMTTKCGNRIVNPNSDKIWKEIYWHSFTYPGKPTYRVEVVVQEDNPGGYDEVTITSIRPIEG